MLPLLLLLLVCAGRWYAGCCQQRPLRASACRRLHSHTHSNHLVDSMCVCSSASLLLSQQPHGTEAGRHEHNVLAHTKPNWHIQQAGCHVHNVLAHTQTEGLGR